MKFPMRIGEFCSDAEAYVNKIISLAFTDRLFEVTGQLT